MGRNVQTCVLSQVNKGTEELQWYRRPLRGGLGIHLCTGHTSRVLVLVPVLFWCQEDSVAEAWEEVVPGASREGSSADEGLAEHIKHLTDLTRMLMIIESPCHPLGGASESHNLEI